MEMSSGEAGVQPPLHYVQAICYNSFFIPVSVSLSFLPSRDEMSSLSLQLVQELARRDVELKELRQKVYQTETTLREVQLAKVSREEKFQDQVEELQETIVRLDRMTTAEGANIEYLKNVVLNYMLSTDVASRNHMLKAGENLEIFSFNNKNLTRSLHRTFLTWIA